MSITRLLSFNAEAEVLGRLHNVSFHGDGLTIVGLSLEDAYAVLKALSLGKLMSADPIITPKASEVLAAAPAPSRNGHHPREEEKTAPPVREPEVPPPAPVAVFEEAVFDDAPSFDPLPAPASSAARAVEPKPTISSSVSASAAFPSLVDEKTGMPLAVRDSPKLQDILKYLHDHGFSTREKLLAECERIRESVPVLRVASTLDVRVKRFLEVFGFDEATA